MHIREIATVLWEEREKLVIVKVYFEDTLLSWRVVFHVNDMAYFVEWVYDRLKPAASRCGFNPCG